MDWFNHFSIGKEAQDSINHLIHSPNTTVFISFHDNQGIEQMFELNSDVTILTIKTVKE